VVGAHLSGLPLNHQLTELGATLVEATRTAPLSRLYALAGTIPPKPGLVRAQAGDGHCIEVEVWAISHAGLGRLIAQRQPTPFDRRGRTGRRDDRVGLRLRLAGRRNGARHHGVGWLAGVRRGRVARLPGMSASRDGPSGAALSLNPPRLRDLGPAVPSDAGIRMTS
jgi:hypothetical protein